MSRKWTSFDAKTTNDELRAIPIRDRKSLYSAMNAYAREIEGRYVLKNYGDGLLMVKATNQTQGRVLFFAVHEENGVEILTALLAYKKETQEVLANIMATARQRLRNTRGY